MLSSLLQTGSFEGSVYSLEAGIDDTEPISTCGKLNVSFRYLLTEEKVLVSILEAKNLPNEERGGAHFVEVSQDHVESYQ